MSVVLKEPSKPGVEWNQALATLRDLGCEVLVSKHGGPAPDFVVVDDGLVWFGGIAPLAYPRKEDCALRIVSRELRRRWWRPQGSGRPDVCQWGRFY